MGRNKYLQCSTCLKNIRSDKLKFHNHAEENISKKKSCKVCHKSMLSRHLIRHMKTHHNTQKEIAKHIEADQEKYEQVKETGLLVKEVLETKNIDPKSLRIEYIKALETNTSVSQPVNITLKLWQEKLLNDLIPSDRQIIWVIGQDGAEGKSWFQRYLIELYGSHKVFHSNISKRSEGILHVLSKQVVNLFDIFIFNIPRSFKVEDVPYGLLEEIKDGQAVSTKYESKFITLKTPNIILIFANQLPLMTEMSRDRWRIFKIVGEDLQPDGDLKKY